MALVNVYLVKEMINRDIRKVVGFVEIVVILSCIVGLGPLQVSCQNNNDDDGSGGGGAGVQILAQELYRASMANITKVLKATIKEELGFCIVDVDADWDGAFNFTKDLSFLTMCSQKLKGDITQRICTAAEIEAYARSFTMQTKSAFLKPNINCNMSSWLNGCEPGWACKANQKVEVNNNKKEIPDRSVDCQPCCEGFFCPQGFTAEQVLLPKSDVSDWQAAGLCFMLIIIYNCSDQVLATRERRQAKSRERAAQSVRETQAREKWKSAKDIAKKHATELQSQLSRTFSRKKSTKTPEFKGVLPPMVGASKAKKKDKNNLSKIINEIEENPDSQEGFNVQIGDKNMKKAPRGKQLHTQSQMFRYAYGQIEKEKALQEQNKNLTFSGVISMASDIDIRKRPTIEVAFKDLTLTLKGKNKHLLRSVTGKLYPGRVSAVMGPSGAGKTTFLSALTGKATGCHTTGQVLVNGQESSITSYKKIIGFVPQDDIVHGNLTVEENLWFSARCRLSADLPKEEKVLVVERVIEALGLQAIRDSLVGTVEKRGISGGQRKRVNVGLEMVMEPSLLILDEPTSGLDSSSSQLLLRALRREALEGVNICMVLHQPSYTLFRMFDDFILLAKGGLTVYHGPVNKVEEYFSSIGIVVPDRVNPPDYYIDILEGIVKLPESSGVNYKQLPVRWMLHNGYPVPMDMLATVEGMATPGEGSAHGAATTTGNAEDTSFAGELWQDVKCNVELKKDNLQHNFLNYSRDLSNRETPGTFTQYRYFLGRLGKQRLREARTQAVDFLILLLAGLCLGTLAKVSDESFGSTGYTYTVIAVSLLSKIAALRSFSLDKLHYWRESASGMSSLAYFLSKDTVDHFSTIIKPLVYLSMFYFFNNPRSSVTDNYMVLLCLVYCVTGVAYVLAIFLQPGPAQLWSVLLPVVLTLVATYDNQEDSKYVRFLSDLCYTKWALEAFVISNAKRRLNIQELVTNVPVYRSTGDVSGQGLSLVFRRWATKKTAGSTKNGRDSKPKNLGVKKFGGERVIPGNIIVRQRGTRFHPGNYVGLGKDHTLFALKEGSVKFERNKLTGRKWVHVEPKEGHVLHPVYADAPASEPKVAA
ncbi:unnamed protein product [Lupinus luteus]|uniref:ABC transporter domain-containing protein n=1 Tax=Lupinus luteus TaxID=3873 RepID=A0AAV1YJ12_LUPLU